jgi:hypothetical protein
MTFGQSGADSSKQFKILYCMKKWPVFRNFCMTTMLSIFVNFCLIAQQVPVPPVSYEMVGKYVSHVQNKNGIDFQCRNALVRLDICTDDILRIRMSPSGQFRPDENWVVIRYDWPEVQHSVNDMGSYILIKTNRMQIKAYKSPFRFEFCDASGKVINRDWKEGSMGFRGKEIICKKVLTATDHFFGLGQRSRKATSAGKRRSARSPGNTPLFLFSWERMAMASFSTIPGPQNLILQRIHTLSLPREGMSWTIISSTDRISNTLSASIVR